VSVRGAVVGDSLRVFLGTYTFMSTSAYMRGGQGSSRTVEP